MNLHEMQILLCGVRRAKIGRGFDQTTLSLFVLFAFVQSRKLSCALRELRKFNVPSFSLCVRESRTV